MGEKTYTRALGEDARKRHFHKTERGKVISFAVQLEVKVEGTWQPVIRYDCAHDFSHIDRYTYAANKKRKRFNFHMLKV